MDKIPILYFFISGFFLSRLVIKTKIPERLVQYLLGEKHISIIKLLMYIIFLAAFLSFFIPNVITVLTLLPLLSLIAESSDKINIKKGTLATSVTLAAMYGANIGGMGSVTATPANGILVTFLELNSVEGSSAVGFASWLVWGIPLVLVFCFAAWLILVINFNLFKKNYKIEIDLGEEKIYHPYQKLTVIFLLLYFITSFCTSVFQISYPEYLLEINIISGIYTLAFIVYLFFFPMKDKVGKAPLLVVKDCFTNLPMKGFLFIGISILIAVILYAFDLQDEFSSFFKSILPTDLSVYLFLLILALLTSFTTELLSNTAIQLSLFVILIPLAAALNLPLTESMIVVTLSSTCAFMSPIATGVNGLAFGGVKGISLKQMLVAGFFVNIAGALIISFWTNNFVPLVLNWFN